MLSWGAFALLLALVWGGWLQPTWKRSERLSEQWPTALAEWHQVSQLAQVAAVLQKDRAVAVLPRAQCLSLARSLTAQAMGVDTPVLQDDGSTLTVPLGEGLTAPQLAQWLQSMRLQARLQPTHVQLQRQATGRWQGRITFSGPPLRQP
jgi:type II secretory pathway component PulM